MSLSTPNRTSSIKIRLAILLNALALLACNIINVMEQSTDGDSQANSPNPTPTDIVIEGNESIEEDPNQLIPPEDLLSVLFWGGRGGGVGDEAAILECSKGEPYVWINTNVWGDTDPASPYFHTTADQGAIGMEFTIEGCNFELNDSISAVITDPTNQEKAATINVDDRGGWILKWLAIPDSPIGDYVVQIGTDSAQFILNFSVAKKAPYPILYEWCDAYPSQRTLIMSGFSPNEQVFLARYEFDEKVRDEYEWLDMAGSIVESGFITVNSNGIALASILDFKDESNNMDVIVAIGSESANMPYQTPFGDAMDISFYYESSCWVYEDGFSDYPIHP